MVALAPDHPRARCSEVRLADLHGEDWTAALTDGLIVRACRAAGFEPNLISITRDQLAIRALVMGGLAVTLVPELLADPFRGLALRPIADVELARDVYALLPPGGRHPLLPPTLAALDLVAAGLRAPSPADRLTLVGVAACTQPGALSPRARRSATCRCRSYSWHHCRCQPGWWRARSRSRATPRRRGRTR